MVVDYSAFETAVVEAKAKADVATGMLAEADLAPVKDAYRGLANAKSKAGARKWVNEQMKSSMEGGDLPSAMYFLFIVNNGATVTAAAGTGTRATREPVDPTEAFVQRASSLRLALDLAQANIPDGVKDTWRDSARELVESSREAAKSYLDWLTSTDENKGDAPEVAPWIVASAKLALGKSAKAGAAARKAAGESTRTYDGPRRNLANHVVEVLKAADGKFLTVTEIAKASSGEYGEARPSVGAVSQRLFPANGSACTIKGVVPTMENGKKGAVWGGDA